MPYSCVQKTLFSLVTLQGPLDLKQTQRHPAAFPSLATREQKIREEEGDSLYAHKVEHSVNLCIIKYNPTMKAIYSS